jgi:hypothetical protein
MPNRGHRVGGYLGHLGYLGMLAAVPLLGAGCATAAPVVRLAPRANDVIWVAGRAAVARDKDGVHVAVAFDRQEEHLLAVRIEVENRNDHPVDVDPNNMTYTTCTGTARETCRPGDTVVDPEGELFALDARRSRERAAAANDRTAAAPLIFLGALGDLANASGGTLTDNAGTASLEADHDEARHARALSRVEAEKQMWSTAALRRTTLFPGQILAGTVYVPIDPHARLVWIQVEIGMRRFPFCFEQTLTRVSS